MIYPVILCGGAGKRLWPLSTADFPKQFLKFQGNHSLIEKTRLRVLNKRLFHSCLFISNKRFQNLLVKQNFPGNFIFEPCSRNTAPALIASVLKLYQEDPNACVLVLPSDHEIKRKKAFLELVERGKDLAINHKKIVLFGILPHYPETGYGYIEPETSSLEPSLVKSFKEKPDLKTAESYIQKGYLWNSGMFLFTAKVFLEEVEKYAKDVLLFCQKSLENGTKKKGDFFLDEASFSKCPSIPIDIAVMEKTNRAIVLPANIGWSDLGTWKAVWDSVEKDESGNFIKNRARVIQTQNCYIQTETLNVSCIGVEGLAIIEKAGELLVLDMKFSEQVKSLS